MRASSVARLKDGWLDEHTAWQRRDLSVKPYVYVWADGIHQGRLEDERQSILVLIGATAEEGNGWLHRWRLRERAGLTRFAARSQAAGLDMPPRLAIADGALGFWKAVGEVWPKMPEQRCWVHKTLNVLDKSRSRCRPTLKRTCARSIGRRTARPPKQRSTSSHRNTAPSTAGRSNASNDRDALLAFCDFRAEHWDHLRTTDEMDKRFLCGRGDGCEDRRQFFLLFGRAADHSSVPATIPAPVEQPTTPDRKR
ncbi:transposase [Bradyrhizobium sp. 157]|uniref:transposase n=1 Tax=Bradyrhizobium sp. 157 TaxID=2782631 RepID=UPI0021125BC3|nr:transposase [Bradyrhizobium sp. 157]MCK1641355.1 transposase [Bradyrhizobium sp. 157]